MYRVQVLPGFIVATVLLCCTISDAQLQSESDCDLPDGGAGVCSSFVDCPTLYELVTNTPRPWSPAFVERIKTFHCGGFENNLPKICCAISVTPPDLPTRSNPLPTSIDRPDVSRVSPTPLGSNDDVSIEYVSNHGNLRLLPVETCGPILTPKISNGNTTELFVYPWMVLLQYESPSGLQFKCGGSLISERYVLTAAHCVTRLQTGTRLVSIRLGEHDLRTEIDCQLELDGKEVYCAEPVQDIRVDSIVAHSNYNVPIGSNDIGLIRLARLANMNENVRPVCLPISEKLQNKPLRIVTVSGWGTTENQTQSQQLLQASLPVITNAECQQFYPRLRLQPSHMCAGGERGVDSCKGDSGGPLVYPAQVVQAQMVQFGIVSLGVNYCSSDNTFPGVYVRVAHYMKWILDNMHD